MKFTNRDFSFFKISGLLLILIATNKFFETIYSMIFAKVIIYKVEKLGGYVVNNIVS